MGEDNYTTLMFITIRYEHITVTMLLRQASASKAVNEMRDKWLSENLMRIDFNKRVQFQYRIIIVFLC